MRVLRGNYALIAAFSLPVVLGMSAIAIDSMRIQLAKFELNHAADSIAHAALISLRDQDTHQAVRKKAQKFSRSNHIEGNDVNIKSNRNLEFGFWDFETNTWTASNTLHNSVRVTLARDPKNKDGPFPLLLTPFLGYDYVNLATDNASIAAMRTRDTMLVMDTTGSFVDEMPDAKKAALTLLTTMKERYITGDRVGMATFVGDGALFTGLADSYCDYADIQARWSGTAYAPPAGYSCSPTSGGNPQYTCSGMEWDVHYGYMVYWYPYPHVVYGMYGVRDWVSFPMNRGLSWCSLRGDASAAGGSVFIAGMNAFASTKVHWAPEMLNCGVGGGGTNQGAGLSVAIDELLANGTIASVKSIVLISDGEPIDGGAYTWEAHFGGPEMGPHNSESFGHFQANEAEDLGYNIFSVSFNDSPSGPSRDAQSAYLNSLTTGFGEFYETPNSEDLPLILKRIGENIPIVIVQ